MKFISIIAIGLLTVQLTLAASRKSVSSETGYSTTSDVKTKKTLATPSALLVTHSPFTSIMGHTLLAPQQGTEVMLSLSQTHIDLNFDSGLSKSASDLDYTIGNLAIAHAMTPNFFLGANIFMGRFQSKNESTYNDTFTYESSSSSKGESDPTLSIGGRFDSTSVSTLLGLGARIKSGNSTYISNEEKNESEGNLKNGGHALIPVITVFSNSLSSSLIGASLSYAIQFERTSIDRYSNFSETSKQTGGNSVNLAAFTETAESSVIYGGALAYTKSEGSKSKSENSAEETSSEGLGVSTISGYVKFNVSEQISIMPNISYGRFTDGFINEATKKDLMSATVTAKATF